MSDNATAGFLTSSVKTLRFDADFGSPERAGELQDKISKVFSSRLQGVLNHYLDSALPPGLSICCEEVTLDIGSVSFDDMEKEMELKLVEKLKEFLDGIKHGRTNLSFVDGISFLPVSMAAMDAIGYFIRTGLLPGQSAYDSLEKIEQYLSERRHSEAQALRRMLLHNATTAETRERIARQFDEQVIRIFVEVLAPSEAVFIIDYHDDVVKRHIEEPLANTSTESFSRTVWWFILSFLLEVRESYFSRKMFVKHTLLDIARHYGIHFEELLLLLEHSVEEIGVNNAKAELYTILYDLSAEFSGNGLSLPVSPKNDYPDELHILEYYLLHGSLPSANLSIARIEDIIAEMARVKTTMFTHLLRANAANDSFFTRLARFRSARAVVSLFLPTRHSALVLHLYSLAEQSDGSTQPAEKILAASLQWIALGKEFALPFFAAELATKPTGISPAAFVRMLKDDPGPYTIQEVLQVQEIFEQVSPGIKELETEHTSENYLADLLEFYLSEGAMPWWTAAGDKKHFDFFVALKYLAVHRSKQAIKLLQWAGSMPTTRDRLLTMLTAAQWLEITAMLEETAEISAFIAFLLDALKTGGTDAMLIDIVLAPSLVKTSLIMWAGKRMTGEIIFVYLVKEVMAFYKSAGMPMHLAAEPLLKMMPRSSTHAKIIAILSGKRSTTFAGSEVALAETDVLRVLAGDDAGSVAALDDIIRFIRNGIPAGFSVYAAQYYSQLRNSLRVLYGRKPQLLDQILQLPGISRTGKKLLRLIAAGGTGGDDIALTAFITLANERDDDDLASLIAREEPQFGEAARLVVFYLSREKSLWPAGNDNIARLRSAVRLLYRQKQSILDAILHSSFVIPGSVFSLYELFDTNTADDKPYTDYLWSYAGEDLSGIIHFSSTGNISQMPVSDSSKIEGIEGTTEEIPKDTGMYASFAENEIRSFLLDPGIDGESTVAALRRYLLLLHDDKLKQLLALPGILPGKKLALYRLLYSSTEATATMTAALLKEYAAEDAKLLFGPGNTPGGFAVNTSSFLPENILPADLQSAMHQHWVKHAVAEIDSLLRAASLVNDATHSGYWSRIKKLVLFLAAHDQGAFKNILASSGHLGENRIFLHDLLQQLGKDGSNAALRSLSTDFFDPDLRSYLREKNIINASNAHIANKKLFHHLVNTSDRVRLTALMNLVKKHPSIASFFESAAPGIELDVLASNILKLPPEILEVQQAFEWLIGTCIADQWERRKLLRYWNEFGRKMLTGSFSIHSAREYIHRFFLFIDGQNISRYFAKYIHEHLAAKRSLPPSLASPLLQLCLETEIAVRKLTETDAGNRMADEAIPRNEETGKEDRKDKVLPGTEYISISNAGLVLLHPTFSMLFSRAGYTEQNVFKSPELHTRALHLLQYVATGTMHHSEHLLYLNKIFCGYPLNMSPEKFIDLTDQEKQLSEEMLKAVIAQWERQKNSSVEGFRQSFLHRDGLLQSRETGWYLKIEHRGYDILLQTLPWAYSSIKTPWMEQWLEVEWV